MRDVIVFVSEMGLVADQEDWLGLEEGAAWRPESVSDLSAGEAGGGAAQGDDQCSEIY